MLQRHMSLRGERIAIVDDEEVMTAVTTAFLRRLGYTTVAYRSGTEFLRDFSAAESKPIDLILTDVVMPGMTGVQLVRTLREQGHAVPILLMTGYDLRTRLELGGTLGRLSFVRKPFSVDQLAQSVRRMLIEPQ